MELHIKKLNHGQSEAWLNPDQRRVIATNHVRRTILSLGETEEARAFDANYPLVGEEMTYQGQHVADIAAALGLAR